MAMTGDPDALQALIDADDQPVFALDRELRYTAFNQAHAATMRALYGVEIALGERLADYQTVDADRETAQANLERVLAGERVIASAYSGEPGRERRYFDIEHTPLTGVAGTVVGVCVHAYDVTERKRAEMALQASASERSLISANVRDVVFRLAVEPHDRFRFVEVNPAFLEVTGLTEDQVVGKLVQEVIPEPAHALVLGNYKKAVRTGKAVGWEEISDYPAGKKYGEVSVAPVYDADETCTHLIGLVHDVTERVRAEEELRKSEVTLRAVLDATPFPVALVDTQDDVIEYWSRSALTLFGHTAPTAAKWDQMAYPDPDYRREVVDRWKPCLEKARLSGEAVNAGEYRVTCRDGSVRVCEQYATFLADRLVVTFNDVTERKRAEEEIRRQTVELATLNRLGAKIGLSLSFDEMGVETAGGLVEALECDLAFLFVRDGDRLLLKGMAQKDGKKKLGEIPEHRVGECLCGLAIQEGVPLYSRDIFNDGRCTWDECRQAGLRSFAALPLRVGDEIIGVVGLASESERDFEEQATFLETLASQVAFKVQNARLFTSVESQGVELREREAVLANAQRIAHLGSWTWDGSSDRTTWSAETYRIYGVAPDVAPTQATLLDLLHPDDRGLMSDWISKAVGGLAPQGVQFRAVRPDGEVSWLYGEGEAVLDETGVVTRLIGTVMDVTERKAAEDNLVAAARQWRETFDAMSDSVALFDSEGRIVRCNAATVALTGRGFEEILGHRCYEVFHGTEDFHRDCPQRRAFKTRQAETCVIEQDGKWLRVTFAPQLDDSGAVEGGVHVVSDVTGLKQTEQRLRQSIARQERISDGVIAALARSVEVRDPYTAGHQRRVGELAVAIARGLGEDEASVRLVQIAAMLHDVGKIVIPAEILSKPGRLTPVEFALIKAHSQAAYDILASIDFDLPVAEIVVQHHERLDGSGYPAGLSGEAIMPQARVLAVADVVEAMVSHRPYRAALPLEAAMAEIADGAGSRYDAAACEAALRLFREQGFAFSE